MRLRATAAALIVAAIGATACVPPVEETTTPAHFNPETVMGEIQARGELRIGIANDRVPLGVPPESPNLGASSVTMDLGRYVARALHVDAGFITAPNDELLGMIDDKSVDIAFPITTITEPLVRHYSFTDPYWVAHQRVLGFGGAYDPEDLSGETVCSFIDPDTEVPLDDLNPAIDLQPAAAPADCEESLAHGHAATASDAVLMGMLASLGEPPAGGAPGIGGDDLTTEGYGAVVISDAPGFIEVVNNILQRAKDDGTWQSSVNRWVGVYDELDRPTAPPDLTVEEAAALYPATG